MSSSSIVSNAQKRFRLSAISIFSITTLLAISIPTNAQIDSESYKVGNLKDIIISAYEHHPQLKSLRAENQGTREVLNEARANYLPQIALDGSSSLTNLAITLRRYQEKL